jgi:hypothetical protein
VLWIVARLSGLRHAKEETTVRNRITFAFAAAAAALFMLVAAEASAQDLLARERLGKSLPYDTQISAAREKPPERIKVLREDLTESTALDFARGRASGIAVVGDGDRAGLQGQRGSFVSGPIELPFLATHLGLHWTVSGGSSESLEVAVRTGAGDRAWTDWYPLTIEAVAQRAGSLEVFAALAPAGRAHLAQYRVTFDSAETVILEAMTITALNSVDGPREALPAETAGAVDFTTPDGKTFTVITREGWLCDESQRFDANGEKWPEMYVPAKKVVIHHTATSNTYTDGAAEVRAIYAYHTGTLGWGDIGYNALVDKYGVVYEGRHGRGEKTETREILSADVVAGHTLSHNYGSLGISAIGNYQTTRPSTALLTAIEDLTTFECARHFIDPVGVSDFLRSDDVWHDDLNNISGHDESNSTQCPGRNLTKYLPALRSIVSSRLDWSSAATLAKDTSARELVVGQPVVFTISADAVWHSLEGWSRAPGEESVTYVNGYELDEQFSDPGAQVQVWSPDDAWPEEGVVIFLQPGHYTMHARPGAGGYEANLTLLVKDTTTTRSIHVGDLDGASASAGAKWTATVTVMLHDEIEAPVASATISGAWSGGYSGSGECTTGADGLCSISTGDMTKRSGTVTFTVTGVAGDSVLYDAGTNHDPDGDSDGTSITIDKS